MQSSSGKLVRRRSYSHPSTSICPAWWSLPAPRGSARERGTQARCKDLQFRLVAGQSSDLFLSVAVHFFGGGWLLLGRMSAVPIRAHSGVWEAAMPLPGKVRPVLMSPARKQTHHMLCLGGRKLITMCIKHKVAGRCTNGMLSFRPRWCYYVHIRYSQCIIFKYTRAELDLSPSHLVRLSMQGWLWGSCFICSTSQRHVYSEGRGCLDASIRLVLPGWQAYFLILCPFLFHISTALRPWNSVPLSIETLQEHYRPRTLDEGEQISLPAACRVQHFSTPKWQNRVLCCRLPNDPAGIVKV